MRSPIVSGSGRPATLGIADQWKPVRQVDSEDIGMMWDDAGMLYPGIWQDDLKNARFDRVWMVLQRG